MNDRKGFTRRDVLLAGGGLAVGVAGAVAIESVIRTDPAEGAAESPFGPNQAGIARPLTPQSHGLVSVFDLASQTLDGTLARLSDSIVACTTAGGDPAATPDGPGDLTVTVGLGPRVVAAIEPAMPGAADLPAFAGDESLAPHNIGGDLLIGIYSSNVGVLHSVLARLTQDLDATLRWQQQGFRGLGQGTITRNPLGYKDGVIVPHGSSELDANVWISSGPAAGGTICVIRRLRLRTTDFRSQSLNRQDEIIGRHRVDGSPLSGGGPDAAIDVTAKTPSGELLTPPRSHVRAAHPSFTGSALMLRRGYAFSNGTQVLADGSTIDDSGLMFICFQHDLDTFVKTQQRIDEVDDLRQFTTATASATFLILPGFSAGSSLTS